MKTQTTDLTEWQKSCVDEYIPKIVKSETILTRATADAGPRIGKVETIAYGPFVTEVKFWYYANGSLAFVR